MFSIRFYLYLMHFLFIVINYDIKKEKFWTLDRANLILILLIFFKFQFTNPLILNLIVQQHLVLSLISGQIALLH